MAALDFESAESQVRAIEKAASTKMNVFYERVSGLEEQEQSTRGIVGCLQPKNTSLKIPCFFLRLGFRAAVTGRCLAGYSGQALSGLRCHSAATLLVHKQPPQSAFMMVCERHNFKSVNLQ